MVNTAGSSVPFPSHSSLRATRFEQILTIQYEHGLNSLMKEVAISEFKAKCLAMLEEVQKTKQSLLVTKFGKPVAEIIPPSPTRKEGGWLGSMKGEIQFLGDILLPVLDESDWKNSNE